MDKTPPKRDETQGTITASLSKDLIAAMDAYCGEADMTRSQLVRAALIDALTAKGVDLSKIQAAPPPRTGKGGRPTHKAKGKEKKDTHAGAHGHSAVVKVGNVTGRSSVSVSQHHGR